MPIVLFSKQMQPIWLCFSCAADGSFVIVYMADDTETFELELTWLRDHPQKYDLGECEFHLAFRTDDFAAAHEKHSQMDYIIECSELYEH